MLASPTVAPTPVLPERPPFSLRARLLTPLADGGTRHEADGLLVVDERGRIAFAGAAADRPAEAASALVLPGWVLLPGMVDLHAHLPQLPNAGLGAGLDLLTWLERYIFPLERGFDEAGPTSWHRPPGGPSRPPAPPRRSSTARCTRPALRPRSGLPRRMASAR